MKSLVTRSKETPKVFDRIRRILESAKTSASRSVNSAQVIAYWLIGKEIVEEEQQGKKRAGYGQALLKGIAEKLSADYGKGFSVQNLKFIRQFYLEFPKLFDPKRNGYAVSSQSGDTWIPGQLQPDLSWTHYRTLLRVSKAEARTFYEIEAIKNNWSARELERQINSLLFERLALSKDKKGVMKLATKGHETQKPGDVFRDPVVIEFLGLPESPNLTESDLETALIGNLQEFPLPFLTSFASASPSSVVARRLGAVNPLITTSFKVSSQKSVPQALANSSPLLPLMDVRKLTASLNHCVGANSQRISVK